MVFTWEISQVYKREGSVWKSHFWKYFHVSRRAASFNYFLIIIDLRLIPAVLVFCMGLLPETQNCGLRMRQECREHFPRHRLQRKPQVSDPGMHHGTCRDACRDRLRAMAGKTFPVFLAHAQPAILRIWQEAHVESILPKLLRHYWWLAASGGPST